MKNLFVIIVTVTVIIVQGTICKAQVTVPNNFGVASDFVGWNEGQVV